MTRICPAAARTEAVRCANARIDSLLSIHATPEARTALNRVGFAVDGVANDTPASQWRSRASRPEWLGKDAASGVATVYPEVRPLLSEMALLA